MRTRLPAAYTTTLRLAAFMWHGVPHISTRLVHNTANVTFSPASLLCTGLFLRKFGRPIPGRGNPQQNTRVCREEILDNRWLTLVKDSEMPRMVPLFALDQTGVRLFLPMTGPDVRRASAPCENAACEPASF